MKAAFEFCVNVKDIFILLQRGIEDPVVTHRSNFDKTSARTVLGSILFSMEPHCSNNENILYSWVKFKPLLSLSVTLKKIRQDYIDNRI